MQIDAEALLSNRSTQPPEDGKRILVYLGSFYMVIVSLLILREHFPNSHVDVVAREGCVGVVRKMKDLGLIDRIVIVKEDSRRGWLRKLTFPAQLMEVARCQVPLANGIYDAILFNTYDKYFLPTLFSLLRANNRLQVFRFEEGFISYVGDMTSLPPKAVRAFGNIANALRGMPTLRNAYSGCFYLEPDHVMTHADDPRLRVRGIKRDDTSFINLLCRIFSYEPIRIDEPIIFFEDCHVNDGHWTNDIELLEHIALIVGKQNIIVKRHPRGLVDRFTPHGFKVMPRSDVPWELIQMKMNTSDKLFVSLISGSPISCIHLLEEKPRALLLHRLMKADAYVHKYALPPNYENYLELIMDEHILVPCSPDELGKELKQFMLTLKKHI